MSSRKLLNYLDGLPNECWYKLSVQQYIEEVREEEEFRYSSSVSGLIFAQLSGQSIKTSE